MSLRKPFARDALFGALAMLLLAAAPARADFLTPAPANPGQAVALTYELEPGERLGREQVIRGRIKCGTNEYLFVLPEGLRADAKPDGALVLSRWDAHYFVRIGVVSLTPGGPGFSEALAQQLTNRHTAARELSAITATVAGHAGCGYQFLERLPGMEDRLERTLWVPFNAGMLEFKLSTSSSQSAEAQAAFDLVLVSFRSNEQGKIQIVRRSESS
jgi:hypothetical protein